MCLALRQFDLVRQIDIHGWPSTNLFIYFFLEGEEGWMGGEVRGRDWKERKEGKL